MYVYYVKTKKRIDMFKPNLKNPNQGFFVGGRERAYAGKPVDIKKMSKNQNPEFLIFSFFVTGDGGGQGRAGQGEMLAGELLAGEWKPLSCFHM